MKKIKVSEASGVVLDWLVAKCAGYLHQQDYGWTVVLPVPGEPPTVHLPFPRHFSPSTRWAQGGPIIERERIRLDPREATWHAQIWSDEETEVRYSPTPLIAAMRCYVASKLGDTVEVPEELIV